MKPRCPKCATKLKHGVCPEKRCPTNAAPPAQQHSDTSVAAAEQIAPHTPTMREKVLAELSKWPGTDEEVAGRLGMNPSTYRPRRIELERDGKVEHVSYKSTSAGRKAKVYAAVGTDYQRTLI